ncbi:uncharacterized protein LOC121707401 [Alosa sapidissima]|uniref:uncharacterized protein LOC121707401 n=1 Tax=Alosa sapidissima TaxID=34773 RepID=UPI001C0A409F|nr:uncharacterized protein LOC121707401 [Alosa sapidissima]XP_041945869.1 uncharacterized protein LOC121707401 [Alosa sapidissima]XP_041945870.1 uncharacterized protein LOC121707401 [Alosa sapidissima]XP_041945871.1 uncharacterized protein LOC121707401 [Alosa sapidissima]XP_041945872.1 uncharacterized protein LOC121707401 [Alosa sapidissima]
MFHYFVAYTAFLCSRWLPRDQRLRFQIILVTFVVVLLTPQLYVLTRPRSSRYCQQPILNNLIVFIIFSFIATGFSVALTLLDPVPQSFIVAFHLFGVLSFAHGLCTTLLTLLATDCAWTTTELYYLSLVLSWACILSTGFFMARASLWLISKMWPSWVKEKSIWNNL